jgi:hypothetical protein
VSREVYFTFCKGVGVKFPPGYSTWTTNLDDLMKVTKRDLLAIAAPAVVIVVLIMITGHEKGK